MRTKVSAAKGHGDQMHADENIVSCKTGNFSSKAATRGRALQTVWVEPCHSQQAASAPDTLGELKQQISELHRQVTLRDSELDAARAQAADALGQVEAMQRADSNNRTGRDELKAQLVRVRIQNKQLVERLEQAEEEKQQLTACMAQKDHRLTSATEEAKAALYRVFQLQSRLDAAVFSSVSPDVAAELTDLRAAATAARAEVKSLAEQLGKARIAKMEACALENSNYHQVITSLRHEISSSKDELKRATTAAAERAAAVKAADIRTAHLEEEVGQLKKRLGQAAAALKERDLVTLDLENQLSKAENDLHVTRDTLAQCQQRMQAAARDLEVKDGELEAATWRIEDLKTQVTDLREAVAVATGAARAGFDAVTELEARCLAAEAQVQRSSAALQAVHVLEEQVAGLKSTLAHKDQQLQKMESEVAEIQDWTQQIANLEKELAAAASQNDGSGKEEELREAINQLNSQLEASEQETSNLKNKLSLLEAQTKLQASKAEQVAAALHKEVGDLREALVVKEQELTALFNEKEKLQSLVQSTKRKLKDQQSAMLEEQKAAVEEANRMHLLDAATLQERIDSLQDELAAVNAGHERLQTKADKAQQADKRAQVAEKQVAQLQAERDVLISTIDQLQQAIAGHEAQHKEALNDLHTQLVVKDEERIELERQLKQASDWLTTQVAQLKQPKKKAEKTKPKSKSRPRMPLQNVENVA